VKKYLTMKTALTSKKQTPPPRPFGGYFLPPPPPGIIGGNPFFKSRILPFGQEKTTNSNKNTLRIGVCSANSKADRAVGANIKIKEKKMKKVIVLCVLAAVLSGCASKPANTTGVSLETAVQEAARQMDSRLPAGTKVALVSVGSSSARLSEYIINQLEAALVGSGKLVVVDRANLDKIRMEQGFQLSGDVSDESAKAIGQLLGAGAIVTGSFTDLGDAFNLTLKAINMETAAVAVSYPADIAKSARIETLLASGGGAGTGAYSGTARAGAASSGVSSAQAPAQPAAPATPAYKVGDTGPAGGIIFYDKGNNSGGWRFLEAAPSDLGKAQWQSNRTDVSGTKDTTGSGRQNTQLIGDSGRAALLCMQYNFGGYQDWFLPSKAELDLMYINLKMKDLGRFSDDWYWSSSQSSREASPTAFADYAWTQRFSDGNQEMKWKGETHSVRAVRQF
jgi:hypothetical protein